MAKAVFLSLPLHGHVNPTLPLVHELVDRGLLRDLDLVAETDGLPPLTELQPDHPYIGWTGTLRTASTREEIDDVFSFVVGDCELEIEEVGPASQTVAELDVPLVPEQCIEEPSVPAPALDVAAEDKMILDRADETADPTKAGRSAVAKPPTATTARVDLDKIDRVVNLVGELVIAQAQLGQVVQELSEDANGRLFQILEEVVHHTRELKDSVMSMRAQPVGSVFQRMPRLIRELATSVLHISAGNLTRYPGDYQYYLEKTRATFLNDFRSSTHRVR